MKASTTSLIQSVLNADYSTANRTFAAVMRNLVAERLTAEKKTVFEETVTPSVLVNKQNHVGN